MGQSRHPTGATFQEESSFLGHKNPHTVSWRAWPLICPTSGPALGAPCPGGHVLAALQDLENCAGPGSYCPQHSEKCVGKPEMGEQSKPVTQEGMALWGAAKAWPCHFQGWGQPAPHSMRTDCQAKCTSPCPQLYEVRAKAVVMLGATRLLHHFHLQELQHQHYQRKVAGEVWESP